MTSGGGMLALLDTLTFPEMMTILVLALVVLGPEKLPGMARQAGQWMNKIKDVASQLQSEVADVMDDPAMKPLKELGEFAVAPRAKLAELARAAITDAEGEADTDAASEPVAPVVLVGPDHPMNTLSGPVLAPEPDPEPDEAPAPLTDELTVAADVEPISVADVGPVDDLPTA